MLCFKKTIYCFFLLLLVSGCKRQTDYFAAFPQLQFSPTNSLKQDDLLVLVKALDAEEAAAHFGVRFNDNGYIPIQLRIINMGPKNYVLSPSYITLPLVDHLKIAEQLHYNTSGFMWGAGTPAFLFFWPATLIVGAEGYDMYRTNKKIDELAKNCCIDQQTEAIMITPYDRIDRFMFIEKNAFVPAFELKLYDSMDKQFIRFVIELDPKALPQLM